MSTASKSLLPLADRTPLAERYLLRERLGRGGMGEIFRAFDRARGEVVALKRVRTDDGERAGLLIAALEREYRVLASLDHPRVVRVFDYGLDAGGPFYTMELVPGKDLSQAGELPWRDVCRIMCDVASALALLHARQLLHRDLSPSNVRMRPDGRCVLLDFGGLTDFGVSHTIVGTPPMVPPEALAGAALDGRADLFSLGALGYWLLTRRHGFPATDLRALSVLWESSPRAPSSYASEVPRALDELILSLLHIDPLARPSSAAHVIAKLTGMAELAAEDEDDRKRIAQSFLIEPPFVGRQEQLSELGAKLQALRAARGSVVRIEALSGSGRTRLLAEIAVRAQLMGITVLCVDANVCANHQGTVRALVLRLLDALPHLARERAKRFVGVLSSLGRDIEERLNLVPSRPPDVNEEPKSDGGVTACDWIVEVARATPMLIEVDNLESCDLASLGVLAALASQAERGAIMLVVSERLRRETARSPSLTRLREYAHTLALPALVPEETESLAHSLFGDAPAVTRFADWLHSRTAGSPLHIVEVSRQLVAQDIIRYEAGLFQLPAGLPHFDVPDALEDALRLRLSGLGPAALALAQLLGLLRREPSLDWCTRLVEPDNLKTPTQGARALLDELVRHEVLVSDAAGYRFASVALRDTLVGDMTEHVAKCAHAKLGAAFGSSHESAELLEAGWHLMQCDEELRGADLVARVLCAPRALMVANRRFGTAAEAALAIYKKHRREPHQRAPLLVALGLAAFFEDHAFSTRYADEALDLIDDMTGLRSARAFARLLGSRLGLAAGLLRARLSMWLTPARERAYPNFRELLTQCMQALVALIATSSIALDPERADRLGKIIAPFSTLPRWSTARVLVDCCAALQQIGRENQARVYRSFKDLLERLADRKRYPLLHAESRALLISAMHFGRASFATMSIDSVGALESIQKLERDPFELFAVIGRQLRALYHANRGEVLEAEQHRAEADDRARQLGAGWQVELWEPAAQMPLHIAINDVVGLARTVHRLAELERAVPSMRFYRHLAECALEGARREDIAGLDAETEAVLREATRLLMEREPRSFIGWAVATSYIAATYNRVGRFEQARELLESAQRLTTDGDRDFVNLFLDLDLQTAYAHAGLGRLGEALQRLDALIARFSNTRHQLALGLLHEARARISFAAGDLASYREHVRATEAYLRPLRAHALIVRCDRLIALGITKAEAASSSEDYTVDQTTDVTEAVTAPGPRR